MIYGKRYYSLFRQNRKNDFRASGSGIFLANDDQFIPDGMLDFANKIYNTLKVPQLSIDVCFDGTKYYLIEFQAVSFGTLTQTISEFYFTLENGKWVKVIEKLSLEKVYSESIVDYIYERFCTK